jgi:hypothetical protein
MRQAGLERVLAHQQGGQLGLAAEAAGMGLGRSLGQPSEADDARSDPHGAGGGANVAGVRHCLLVHAPRQSRQIQDRPSALGAERDAQLVADAF